MNQEILKRNLHYDPETGEFYWRRSGKLAGRLGNRGYVLIKLNCVEYIAQRLAFLYMTGRWPEYAEHRNGIRNDNRWVNLREATKSGDQANRDYGPNRGVEIRGNSFRARIKVNGDTVQLGSYGTIEEARLAYREAADLYFGEFAFHNREA